MSKKSKKGSGKNCKVFDCTNCDKKMNKWKKETCQIHSPEIHAECECLQPYQMHRFPNGKSSDSAELLKLWLKNINRKDFIPNSDSRVCSIHFPDGRPTKDHPYPSKNMGYKTYKALSPGRPAPRKRIRVAIEEPPPMADDLPEDSDGEAKHMETQTPTPQTRDASTQWNDASVSDPVVSMQSKATQTEQCPEVSVPDLEDASVKFYTGLSKEMFWTFLNSMLMCMTSAPKFRMPVHDQVLLVLMRLRLGLMFTDLGARFRVSRTTACDIFNVWLPEMARYMTENIIFWPTRETLARIRPKSFMENHPKATCIIDCTEVFVQRPKNLKQRAQTYSNYKHHNTYKALYCIAPNGFVTYVSKLFGGRASDVFISQTSGFIDQLLPGDEVLADRGFTISDILPEGVKLTIPAFTKGHKDRRLPEELVTSTRRIANVRIHVERAIRRLKCFKILSNIIPNKVKNVDDMLIVCAGLCNLQPSLINDFEESDNEETVDLNDSEMETDTEDEAEDNNYNYDFGEFNIE